MIITRLRSVALAASAILVLCSPRLLGQTRPGFRIEETTIAGIHGAFKAKTLTCHSLVQQYLARIDANDKQGPAINALLTLNPNALTVADSLDKRYAKEGARARTVCSIAPLIVSS